MRGLIVLVAMSLIPLSASAGIPTTNLGAGELLSIARDEGGVTALVNTLDGLAVRRTTPDGGWGEPGLLSEAPAESASLSAVTNVAHAAWVSDGLAMYQIVSDGVPQGDAIQPLNPF